MSQFRLLEEIIKKLESSSIPYMLTGSIVSSLQGIPRSTHDIDVMISISEKDIEKIISNFSKEDFYYNEETNSSNGTRTGLDLWFCQHSE